MTEQKRKRIETLAERRAKRKIKKGKATLVFFFLFLFLGFLFFGIWKLVAAYQAPWGPPLQKNEKSFVSNNEFQNRFFNLLIVGLGPSTSSEEGTTQGDSFFLFSMDRETKQTSIVVIPRDTEVFFSNLEEKGNLRQVYQQSGKEELVWSLEHLLQIPIEHYLIVDETCVPAIIDAMGGLSIYVHEDMKYTDSYMDPPLEIDLKKGTQILSGEQVMHFLRFRSDELADLGRFKRHQAFLKILQSKLSEYNTLFRLPQILSAFAGRSETDLSVGDFLAIGWASVRNTPKEIFMLPGESTGKSWKMDTAAWGEMGSRLFPINFVKN